GPNRVEAHAARGLGEHEPGGVALVLRDQKHLAAADGGVHAARELGEEVAAAVVLNRVRRVEPKAVDVVLGDPREGVLDEEVADVPAVLALEIDAIAPRT